MEWRSEGEQERRSDGAWSRCVEAAVFRVTFVPDLDVILISLVSLIPSVSPSHFRSASTRNVPLPVCCVIV